MPCVYDDVPGSWGDQSKGWPSIVDPDGIARRMVIEQKLVPYGSYVTVGAHLRLETQEYVDKVRKAMQPEETNTAATGMGDDAVAALNAALGAAFPDDPANAVRAHAAVLPLISSLAAAPVAASGLGDVEPTDRTVLESFLSATQREYGYRPQLWGNGEPINSRDYDRLKGFRMALAAQPAPNFGVGVDVSGDSVAVSVVHREGALDTVIYSEIHPLPAQPAPVVEDDAIKCETCDGVGSFDERLGGEHFSNPKAPCPDCDGHGEVYPAQPAPVVGGDARDLIGQLVSLAAMYDQPLAKNIAERLDALLAARPGGEGVMHDGKEVAWVAKVQDDWTTLEIMQTGDGYAFNRATGRVYKIPDPACPFVVFPARPVADSGGYDRAMIADYLEDYADGLFEDHEVTVESARDQARLLRSAVSTAAQQNTVEVAPVCWSLSGFIRADDGRPIGTDEPRVVWGAECPDETEGWSPLYTHPAQAGGEDARDGFVRVPLDALAKAATALSFADCYDEAADLLSYATAATGDAPLSSGAEGA